MYDRYQAIRQCEKLFVIVIIAFIFVEISKGVFIRQ